MKKIILCLLLLFLASCTTINDNCVTDSIYNQKICQKDIKVLPPDFPQEIFKKWFPFITDNNLKMFPVDFDGDNSCDGFYFIWGEKESDSIVILYTSYINDDEIRAWAFVEITDKAKEIWVAKETESWKVERLKQDIEEYNPQLTI